MWGLSRLRDAGLHAVGRYWFLTVNLGLLLVSALLLWLLP